MNTERSVEDQIRSWLLRTAPAELPDRVFDATFTRTRSMVQASGVRPWRNLSMRRRPILFATGAVAISVIAVATVGGLGFLRESSGGPAAPTPAPTASPSMIWTPDAAKRDWPGPLRTEAAVSSGQLFRVADYVDQPGDSGAADPWGDISHVTLRTGNTVGFSNPIGLQLAGGLPSVPDPTTRWIAYGVVVDLDGDGRADQRIGIDNSTRDHREWITDLATGRTEVNLSATYGAFSAFGTRIETWYVDDLGSVAINVKRTPGGIQFYTWASTISDGGVVATDFAPDTGWIETVSP